MKSALNIFLLLVISASVFGQAKKTAPLSERLADTAMNRIWTDDGNPPGIPPNGLTSRA